jgi:hypothetical protein
MTEPSARRPRGAWCPLCALFCSIIVLAVFAFPESGVANGSDFPSEIVMQGFVKVEDGRAHLLVRIPLLFLANLSLPKRGPGYLDLTNIDARLRQAATVTGRQIELRSDGATLAPIQREVQLALPSDRSFASYSTALAHLQGPPLPANTDLFSTQGYFDVHFEYSLQSSRPDIGIRVNVGPEFAQRVKLRLEYVPVGEPVRTYEILGNAGWIPLDPRGYETAWLFIKVGFVDAFAIDRFVLLLCLIAPFRNFRGLLALVIVFAALQAVTLTAAAEGALADVEVGWLPFFSNTVLAAAMVLLAIGNLAAPTLRRRGLITAVVGALGGFGLGRLLTDAGQFAGTHPLVAVIFFNVGIAIGAVVSLAIAFFALRLVFARVLGPLLGVIVLSILAGHVAWHGMMNNGAELGSLLGRVPTPSLWPALAVVALWLIPALLVGTIAYFLLKRTDGLPVPSLRQALFGRNADEGPARG